jgi:hypothetical protein
MTPCLGQELRFVFFEITCQKEEVVENNACDHVINTGGDDTFFSDHVIRKEFLTLFY